MQDLPVRHAVAVARGSDAGTAAAVGVGSTASRSPAGLSARSVRVAARGGNGFMTVAASHAALLLAQGSGRLLRGVSPTGAWLRCSDH